MHVPLSLSALRTVGLRLQVAAGVSCVGWMAVSSGLIMLNKHLMSTDGFHFPMGLSLLGMGFSSIASYIACRARTHPEPACSTRNWAPQLSAPAQVYLRAVFLLA